MLQQVIHGTCCGNATALELCNLCHSVALLKNVQQWLPQHD